MHRRKRRAGEITNIVDTTGDRIHDVYTALTQRTDKKRFIELQGTSATPLARISALSSASARRCSRQSEPRSGMRAIGARRDRFERG